VSGWAANLAPHAESPVVSPAGSSQVSAKDETGGDSPAPGVLEVRSARGGAGRVMQKEENFGLLRSPF